jgi:ATP-dependent DNA ligase
MTKVYSTPLVQKKDSKKNVRYWIGYVIKHLDSSNTKKYYTSSEYWGIKSNGEESLHQQSELVQVSSKNVGKSNETTELDQAISEINSLYSKKLDEGYREETKVEEIFLPMLAQKFTNKVKFPAYIQPKLDGQRMFLKPDGTFWTRKGKQVLPEVTKHIKADNSSLILDGELMLPLGYTFQETISAIKKYGDLSNQLVFHIFDCYDPVRPQLSFQERFDTVFSILNTEGCVTVPSYLCYALEQFKEKAAEFIAQGYEGAMYRTSSGLYKVNHRSADLLKYKEFQDDEFVITNVVCGVGREQDCAIFVCVTEEGNTFGVRPKGTIESRKEMYANKDSYIGKLYTVKYQELTDGGLPRFPVGIGVRDFE